jgi:phosphatidylinositol glycan class Q protein
MHPFSVLALSIFVAGYITARWDLVTRLYELAIFAWDHGVVTRAAKGFGVLSLFFFLFIIPVERIAGQETEIVCYTEQNVGEARLIQDTAPSRRISRGFGAPAVETQRLVLVGMLICPLAML